MAEDYEVGYRKPPVETRFKAGESGNRSGRPRKVKSQDPMIEFFLETMAISENGKPKKETTLKTLLKIARVEIVKGGSPRLLLALLKFHNLLVAARVEEKRLQEHSDERDFNEFIRVMTAALPAKSLVAQSRLKARSLENGHEEGDDPGDSD